MYKFLMVSCYQEPIFSILTILTYVCSLKMSPLHFINNQLTVWLTGFCSQPYKSYTICICTNYLFRHGVYNSNKYMCVLYVHTHTSPFQALLGIIMLIPSDIGQLINSFNAAAWIFYGLCFASLLIMRITRRRDNRPYKVCANVHCYSIYVKVVTQALQ